jgi:hypothetical protein
MNIINNIKLFFNDRNKKHEPIIDNIPILLVIMEIKITPANNNM